MILYPYVMTYNTGFAPCIYENMLSLACCKTKLRYKIGTTIKASSEHEEHTYIMGLCGKGLLKRNQVKFGSDIEKLEYSPIYIARVTDVVSCEEYYSKKEFAKRPDCKYKYQNGHWAVKENNPHYDGKKVETIDFRDTIDLSYNKSEPNYVLLSDEYIYWGRNLIPFNEIDDKFPTYKEIKNVFLDVRDTRRHSPRSDTYKISKEEESIFELFFKNYCYSHNKLKTDKEMTIDDYFIINKKCANVHCEGTEAGGNE